MKLLKFVAILFFFCEGSQLCDGNHATKAQQKWQKHHNYTYKSEVRTERGFSPKRCTDWLLKINFMLYNNQATLKTVMPIYVFSINEHEPWVEDWKKIL